MRPIPTWPAPGYSRNLRLMASPARPVNFPPRRIRMRRGFILLLPVVIVMQLPARSQEPIPYGAPINLEAALKVMAAAEAEARKQNWAVAITIVDGAGFLVAFHRLDNTQLGSVEISQEKARTA